MGTTKYIVNNLSGQTMSGDLTIGGNLTVNSNFILNSNLTLNSNLSTNLINGSGVYRALLTQTGQITGISLADFNFGLIIGETYTILNFIEGDDFSNIALVKSGNINETGCVFIATGEIPQSYTFGSTLQSSGDIVVNVLENTLEDTITWNWVPFGGNGYYIALMGEVSTNNGFPRNDVDIKAQLSFPFDWAFPYLSITTNVLSFVEKDNCLILNVYDWDITETVDNALYYTPVEIKIKYDKTPTQINGNITTFPFDMTVFTLQCNYQTINEPINCSDTGVINNTTELVLLLNNDIQTNVFGVFSEDGMGGIILTMEKYKKQRFCEDNVLTFVITGHNI